MTAKLAKEDDPTVTINVEYIHMVESGAPIYAQLHNILIRIGVN